MIKTLIASGVAVSAAALASPALADVYVNPEFNGGIYGDDYLGGTLNLDVGYEVSDGPYSFYIQGGPAIVMPDGVESEVELAGNSYLHPNTNGAENTYAIADIVSNGFKMRYAGGLANQTGEEYVWAAWASHPFKTARAR